MWENYFLLLINASLVGKLQVMKKHNWNCGRQQIMFKCKTCDKIFGARPLV